jgi:hypothetical protein
VGYWRVQVPHGVCTGCGKMIYGTSALMPSACNCYLISTTLASFVYCYLMW